MALSLPKMKLSERINGIAAQIATFPAMMICGNDDGPGNPTSVARGLMCGIVSVVMTLPLWLPVAGVAALVACLEAK